MKGSHLTSVTLAGRRRSKLGPSHQPIHGPLCSSAGQTAGIIHHTHRGAPVLFVRLRRSYAGMLGGFARGGEPSKRRSGYRRGRRGRGRLRHISGFWLLRYVVVFTLYWWQFIHYVQVHWCYDQDITVHLLKRIPWEYCPALSQHCASGAFPSTSCEMKMILTREALTRQRGVLW